MSIDSRPEGPVIDVMARNKELRTMAAENPEMLLVESPVWDEAECTKRAKHRGTDRYGNVHPYTGRILGSADPSPIFGVWTPNGGTVIHGVWYDGVCRLWPKIPDTFEIVKVLCWGHYIRKKI